MLDNEFMQSFSKNHSNLVAIDICTVKSRNGGKDIEPCTCIVIICFAKGFVPIGENLFPQKIKGIQTDVREGYSMAFGTKDYNNPIGPGCSVGLKDSSSSGSIGFLLKHKEDGQFAFVSSAHVFFDYSTLQNYADGHQHLHLNEFEVVQPSNADNTSFIPETDRICGHVENIYFNKTEEISCKDLIVVTSGKSRHPVNSLQHPTISETSKEKSGCYNWPDGYNILDCGIPDEDQSLDKTVIKVGRTTELTRGRYDGRSLLEIIRVDTGGRFIRCRDILKIKGDAATEFSRKGDSGAGIFLELGDTLKPFGILEGYRIPGVTLAIPAAFFKSICPDYDFQSFSKDASDGNVPPEMLYSRLKF